MFGLSPPEVMIIGVVAILLFGNRLPEVARSVGKSFNEFKRGLSDIQAEFHETTSRAATTTRPRRAAEDRDESSGPKFEPPPAEGAA